MKSTFGLVYSMNVSRGNEKFTKFTMKIRRYQTIWKTLRWKTVCCYKWAAEKYSVHCLSRTVRKVDNSCSMKDGTGFHTCKECHKTESLWNHTTTDHKEGEQLEDRRSVGASSCNSVDGTDQRVQSLMFMMMMMKDGSISTIIGDISFWRKKIICCMLLDGVIKKMKRSVNIFKLIL